MDVITAIRNRRSVRAYKPDPIDAALVERVTEALRLAPSACNHQPWRFILVTQPDLRRKLGHAAHDQMFIADAPIIIVGCGLAAHPYPRMGDSWNSAEIDVAIAMDQFMLAATEAGLGTCWIGAFDEREVKALLDIPDEAKVVAMSPLGWPKMSTMIRPIEEGRRRSRAEIFSTDQY